jgi:flagellar motor switch protein FliG
MLSNTKKIGDSDTLEDRLQSYAWNRMVSITQKVKSLQNITENLGNQYKKKPTQVDDKSLEEIKNRIDKENEKAFMQGLNINEGKKAKMKVIRQPSTAKDKSKDKNNQRNINLIQNLKATTLSYESSSNI